MFTLIPTRAFITTTCLAILPTFAVAQNVLTPLNPSAERPYPYEILGMQPGGSLDDMMAVFASKTDEAPTSEGEVTTVKSPDGRSFEFTFERLREIGGQTMNERIGRVFKPENVRSNACLQCDGTAPSHAHTNPEPALRRSARRTGPASPDGRDLRPAVAY